MEWSSLWVALGLVAVAWVAARMAEWVWWRPRRLERALRSQGLRGNPYRLIVGDLRDADKFYKDALSKPITPFSHSIVPRVLPQHHHTITKHGKLSFEWIGPNPTVCVADPELIQEILSNKFGHFKKYNFGPLGRLLATGLTNYEGEKWARHKRIINPAFHVEKLKCMLPAFTSCCTELIARWDRLLGPEGSRELDVWPALQSFTGYVISRTAFGLSYAEGRRIFQLQSEQAELVMQFLRSVAVFIPGYRFLPTPKNIRSKEIETEVRALLRGMIEKREKAVEMGDTSDDLLGLLMESNSKQEERGNSKNIGMTTEEVIDECNVFYFAGQETTSALLNWTMILLSMNPSWQARAREEVLQVFGKEKPNMDGLNHLKIVTMILYEVLRLYPPAPALIRKIDKTVTLGGFTFPAGLFFLLPIILIHHDQEMWGKDAEEFNPERFSRGVSKASKNQAAFFPFGWGPRICIGQNFAMLEAKIGLSMILQHFSFDLSPHYVHAPSVTISLQPQHGALIMLRRQ